MLLRFARQILILAALGVLYAGPVSACACPHQVSHSMPCCPDDMPAPDQPNCAQPAPTATYNVCDPVPADTLSAGTIGFQLPPPADIYSILPAPPFEPIARAPATQSFRPPPIYLITLRLRI